MKNKKQLTTILLIAAIAALLIGSIIFYNAVSKKPADPLPAEEATITVPESTQLPLTNKSTSDLQQDKAGEPLTEEVEETPQATKRADIKTTADFSMLTLNGKETKLSDFFGKPIVLNFWASWCGPCRMEMPYFDALYKEMKDDVHFIMVNLTTAFSGAGETPEKAKNFIEEQGYSFPVYLDVHQQGATNYAIISIPQTFFINADGEVVNKKIGVISQDELKANIEKLLQ